MATATRCCLVIVLLALSGCASSPQYDQLLKGHAGDPAGLAPGKELDQVAFFPQSEYQCGPAALATLMADAGHSVNPADLVGAVYVPGKRGSLQVEMLAATRQQQLIPIIIEPQLAALLVSIDAGHPVLVLQNLGIDLLPRWHYAVAIGYDLEAGEILLRSGEIRRRVTALPVFENTWRRSKYWGFVAVQPGELPAFVSERQYVLSLADFLPQAAGHAGVRAAGAGVDRWPANTLLQMMLAEAYAQAGDDHAAESVYRQIVRQNPRYAPAHNNLAILLLRLGQDQAALDHARRAVSLGGPHVEEYKRTLADIRDRR